MVQTTAPANVRVRNCAYAKQASRSGAMASVATLRRALADQEAEDAATRRITSGDAVLRPDGVGHFSPKCYLHLHLLVMAWVLGLQCERDSPEELNETLTALYLDGRIELGDEGVLAIVRAIKPRDRISR